MKQFCADFETTTDPNDCRVWSWGLMEFGTKEYHEGDTIAEFFQLLDSLSRREKCTVYFHNLKFDGFFILHHLLAEGFSHVKEMKELRDKSFTSLITDLKTFYTIDVCLRKRGKNRQTLSFVDSLKIIPFSVEQTAKAFGLSMEKMEIDYTKPRPEGYKVTEHERLYVKTDVEIMVDALSILFDEKHTKITAGGNALQDFKRTIGTKAYKTFFPKLKFDDDIRDSYKGGFVYVNPKFKDKEIGEGIVLDVNSLYPSVMRYEILPFGEPKFFEGKYKHDKGFPLYIVFIRCMFELKPNRIPTVQIKNSFYYTGTEYLHSSDGQIVTLALTNIDFKLFLEQYEVINLEIFGGYKFRGRRGIFDNYIDKWSEVKMRSKDEGNAGMYTLSKLMLNSLYGKFGSKPTGKLSKPYLDDEVVNFVDMSEEERPLVYLPMASFITSYARNKTIRSAQANYDRFIYADTDSLHLTGHEIPNNLDIDDLKLGYWSLDEVFKNAKYLRAKSYIQTVEKDGQDLTLVTIAGLPRSLHKHINYDNFKVGTKFTADHAKVLADSAVVLVDGDSVKLRPKRVKGGVILEPTDFTING